MNRRALRRLLVTASVVLSSAILATLIKEAQSFSETSALTRATQRNNPEDAILLKMGLFRAPFTVRPTSGAMVCGVDC
jgi:hypothetical protein